MDAFEGSVIRGQAAVVQRNRVHSLLGHILLGEGGGDFAGPVVAEVVEDDGIAFLDLGEGLTGGIGNDAGFHELIGHIGIVRSLDGIDSGRILGTHAAHQHVVGLFYAVPAFVAVHRIETAAHRGNLTGGFGHLAFQLLQEAAAAARIGITTVHERVDIDLVQAFLRRYGQEFIHMLQGAVDTAMGRKAHQVELLSGGLHILIDRLDFRIVQQFVAPAGHVDLDQVLIDHAAGTEVHVTHLGVAHLPVRQTHIFAAGLQRAVRIFCAQGIDYRRSLGPNGIGIIVAAFTPAVQNHQEYFSVHISFVILFSYLCGCKDNHLISLLCTQKDVKAAIG